MRLKYLAAALLTTGALVAAPAATAHAAAPTARSGMELMIDETFITTSSCTLGAVVSPTRALTAGHCGNVGQAVRDGRGVQIGTITANRIARGLDIAVIRLARGVDAQPDAIAWNATFTKGQPVTKSGITTGVGRGVVTDPRPTMRSADGFSLAPPFLISHSTMTIETDLLARPGDSGGPVRDASGRVVGILSAAGERFSIFAPVSYLPANQR